MERIIPNTTGAAAVVLEVSVTFLTGKVFEITTGVGAGVAGFATVGAGVLGAGPAGQPPPPAEVTVYVPGAYVMR